MSILRATLCSLAVAGGLYAAYRAGKYEGVTGTLRDLRDGRKTFDQSLDEAGISPLDGKASADQVFSLYARTESAKHVEPIEWSKLDDHFDEFQIGYTYFKDPTNLHEVLINKSEHAATVMRRRTERRIDFMVIGPDKSDYVDFFMSGTTVEKLDRAFKFK